jgi:hypothetical protein
MKYVAYGTAVTLGLTLVLSAVIPSHPNWSGTLMPGEEATLLISFDPVYHGLEGFGVQQKAIRINAGDIWNPMAKLRISATVVGKTEGKSILGSAKAWSQRRKERHRG